MKKAAKTEVRSGFAAFSSGSPSAAWQMTDHPQAGNTLNFNHVVINMTSFLIMSQADTDCFSLQSMIVFLLHNLSQRLLSQAFNIFSLLKFNNDIGLFRYQSS